MSAQTDCDESIEIAAAGRRISLLICGDVPEGGADAFRDMAERTLHHVLSALPPGRQQLEISVLFLDDEEIQELNRTWRGLDKPTNVLSFPAVEDPCGALSNPGSSLPAPLGDIAISCETLKREAEAAAKPLDHHMKHLMVHGILHLLGYDHEIEEEAEIMESAERAILAAAGVPDPYGE